MLCLETALGAAQGPRDNPVAAIGIALDGTSVNPMQAAQGKPVVLIFVRTDCPVSGRYAPTIEKISAQYSGRIAFWLVYPDKAESPAQIREYMQKYGYQIPGLRDPQHSLVRASQARITPEAAVFDGSGKLIYHGRIDNWYEDFGRARSAPTTHELDDAIRAALADKQPPVASADAVGCYIADVE
jgi:hypothetical protein